MQHNDGSKNAHKKISRVRELQARCKFKAGLVNSILLTSLLCPSPKAHNTTWRSLSRNGAFEKEVMDESFNLRMMKTVRHDGIARRCTSVNLLLSEDEGVSEVERRARAMI